ncbi:MAG TPA: biotin carboxylase N-terminal domain-containing protein [Thermoanaerobaculia bacterium]|jgi:acetyl/propionyl-CoA carboxylase alpha subunit
MIRRLLVANRGEIAVRVLRTAREMGIGTVAIFAEEDAGAVHVARADRAEPLGGGPVSETYLSVGKILEAARASGADAVHPGYGFLAESPEFARAVEAAGLVWVGPPAGAIEEMGDKLRSRARMRRAGVPVVPGSDETATDDDALAREAERLGYPVLVKASAGGGGKGMSIVGRGADLPAALEEGRHIAAAAFGDGTVYLEKLLSRPRHVEFQVFADQKGHTVHLFERECSVQRRHQKIVEETPSPALDPVLRRAMGEAAVEAARAVHYVGAGTIEFLLDEGRRFYFLEMNTRLQVEHPITEETLGIDLVRWQIEIAQGSVLPAEWRNGGLAPRGHAIELRLYAEDPVGFLPRAGTVLDYVEPAGPGLRVDSGIQAGSTVSVDYDPLLAKLVARGENRSAAIERSLRALGELVVLGVETNGPLLDAVLRSEEFRSGRYDTGLVSRLASLEPPVAPDAVWIAAALALSNRTPAAVAGVAADPWSAADGWRSGGQRSTAWGTVRPPTDRHRDTVRVSEVRLESAGHEREVRLEKTAASLDGEKVAFRRVRREGAAAALEVGAELFLMRVARQGDRAFVWCAGKVFEVRRAAARAPRARSAAAGESHAGLVAPMPGRVRKTLVRRGEEVAKGQVVLVLEAMKMEHAIRAPQDGIVTRLELHEGDLVEAGAVLAEIN